MFGQGPKAPQLKFDDLFNQHFSWLFFLKYLCVKTGEVGGELLNFF